jgi:hypothetical protein
VIGMAELNFYFIESFAFITFFHIYLILRLLLSYEGKS